MRGDARDDEPPSKSRIKRDHLALQALGRELVECPERIFLRLALPERIREEARIGRTLERGALQRQLRHLGGMLAHEDHAAIRAALQRAVTPDVAETRRLHRLEQLRETLLTGEQGAQEALIREYPGLDRQQLRQLVRAARQEAASGTTPPRATRALFQFLKQLDLESKAARVDQ